MASKLVPVRPLTPRQSRVAELLASGCDYKRIGVELGTTAAHVRNVVYSIADLLPNDAGLTPYRLVERYAWSVAKG